MPPTNLTNAGPGGNSTFAAPDGTARFHVDVQTGQVSVTPLTSRSRAVFSGSAVSFSSSTLIDDAGDVGRKLLSVSLTNNRSEPLGLGLDGTDTGVKVIFGPFSNVTNLTTDLRSQTVVSTVVGTGVSGSADGAASVATLHQPAALAPDGSGGVYEVESSNKVRHLSHGFVSTLAGSGTSGGADGVGSAATFNNPKGIAVNPLDGSLIVSEFTGDRIRRVTRDGRVTLVAGTGAPGSADGTGSSASFANPDGVTVDSSGTIYVADSGSNKIRKITLSGDPTLAANYTVTTLAGSGSSTEVNGVGSGASFSFPYGIVVDDTLHLYVTDKTGNRIRLVSQAGEVTTIAGSGSGSADGPGSTATFNGPAGIALFNGALIVSDAAGNRIRQITLQNGASPASASSYLVRTLAGTGAAGSADGSGAVATFNFPALLTTDASGSVYIPDQNNNRIRRLAPGSGFFPLGASTGAVAVTSEPVQLSNPDGVVPQTGAGTNLPYVQYRSVAALGTSDTKQWAFVVPAGVNAFEFTVTVEANTSSLAPPESVSNPGPSGAGSPAVLVRTVAGSLNGLASFVDGVGSQVRFNAVLGLCTDRSGNLYIADGNNSIRRMGVNGVVTTVAGSTGSSIEADGTGNIAAFNSPQSVVCTPDGTTLYVADFNGCTIRRVSTFGGDPTNAANWNVATIVGKAGTTGNTEGTGNVATLNAPTGLAMDSAGGLYVSETTGNRIRRIRFLGGDPNLAANYQVSLLAGDGSAVAGAAGFVDAAGSSARFNGPIGLALDRTGNLLVADSNNDAIRSVTPDGVTTTFAGTNSAGYADGVGTAARFSSPSRICVDTAGYAYVSDFVNRLIRRISPGAVVSTVAGVQGSGGTVDGPGNVAKFDFIYGISVDPSGNVYVGALSNIRMVQRVITSGTQ